MEELEICKYSKDGQCTCLDDDVIYVLVCDGKEDNQDQCAVHSGYENQ